MRETARETFRDDKDANGDWIDGTAKRAAEQCRAEFMRRARSRLQTGKWEVELRQTTRHEVAVILWEK